MVLPTTVDIKSIMENHDASEFFPDYKLERPCSTYKMMVFYTKYNGAFLAHFDVVMRHRGSAV